MKNIDAEIESFINETSAKTGGITEMARLEIKYFIKEKMIESYYDGMNYCKDLVFAKPEIINEKEAK